MQNCELKCTSVICTKVTLFNLYFKNCHPDAYNFYMTISSLKFKNFVISGPLQLRRYSSSLLAGRPRHRTPVGVRFSSPVQTGPVTHPASCTVGVLDHFPEAWR